MLNKLISFLKPTKIEDPFFGSLRHMGAALGKLSYWEGERAFGPLGQPVEVFIDTLSHKEGPSEAQRDFFRRVERDYRPICSVMKERFRFDPWTQRLMRDEVEDEFSLGSVSIPLCREPIEDWSLALVSATEDAHIFTVYFRGMEPKSISADG